MSIQRRLILYLALCAPLVWGVAFWYSAEQARHEVDELFDTSLIRLARQVQALLIRFGPDARDGRTAALRAVEGDLDVESVGVAVWSGDGRPLLADHDGTRFAYRRDASGFDDVTLDGVPWRVYYLQSSSGEWLVAAGQQVHEREEVVLQVTMSQLLPWLAVLPLLLLAMAFAARQALRPLRRLSHDLTARGADDLQPLPDAYAPDELVPLLASMNALFDRIRTTLARERRFTADAAHELRTPLAVLRAQWDVVRRAADPDARRQAESGMTAGFERLDRLVSQMLSLSKIEGANEGGLARAPVAWPSIVADVFSDCLPLAERRHIELECEWPEEGCEAMPLRADQPLLTVLLRNLVDNAVRYAPGHSSVRVRFGADRLTVENDGPGLAPALRARLGERFFRPDGQAESGSGLGISIVQRIAALHGLRVDFGSGEDGRGVRVVVQPAIPDRPVLNAHPGSSR